MGSIRNDTLELSPVGNVVEITWKNMEIFFDIKLDEYVIMPNHFHGIIWINPRTMEETPTQKATRKSSLISIIQTFKSLSSKRIHSIGYSNQVWQRSYYETIIRDDEHLNSTREYIQNNPVNWAFDEEFLL
jgi:REP element-mobilizing transposase RayT